MNNMSFSNQTILVVGGAGFVGSNLVKSLLLTDVEKIIVVDNLLSAVVDNVPQNRKVHFVLGSIADDRVLERIGKEVDYVFHLATYHGNQSSIADPIADHDNNTITTLKLCEHFKGMKRLKQFVYSSAGCTVAKKTYDDPQATEENAEVSLYHDSPYQISKIVGEFYGNFYWMKYALPFVKARFQNVYGPGEILGAGQWRGTSATVWRNVTPTFIWKALHNMPMPLENGGAASRDFIYVDDIVNGLITIALCGKAGEVYNLASGVETTIATLADMINHITGNEVAIDAVAARSWDRSGKRFGSISKAKAELGFEAMVDLESGLKRTIEWTKQNEQMISSNILRHYFFLEELKRSA